jgi:hypothetical protein
MSVAAAPLGSWANLRVRVVARSTGIGWALGVGRVGAVLGPLAGGLLVGSGATLGTTFGIFAAVSLVAAALVWQLRVE